MPSADREITEEIGSEGAAPTEIIVAAAESPPHAANRCDLMVAEGNAIASRPALSFSDRLARAKAAFYCAGQNTSTAAFFQIRAGLELLEIRKNFNYGQWGGYIKRKWPGVTPRTLQRHLAKAELWPSLRGELAQQSSNKATALSLLEPEDFIERVAQGDVFDFQAAYEKLKSAKTTKTKKRRKNLRRSYLFAEEVAVGCFEWEQDGYAVVSTNEDFAADEESAQYTLHFDGKWGGRVLLLIAANSDADRWISKALTEYEAGNIDEAIVIAPADFRRPAIDGLLRFPIAICRILNSSSSTTRSTTKPLQQAFLVAFLSEQPNLKAITAAFEGFGRVLCPPSF